jgi:Predicted membrane protein
MADDIFGLPEEGSATEAPDFARDEPQAADTEVSAPEAEELYPGRPEPAEEPERARGPDGRFLPKEPTQPMAEGEKAPEGLEDASAEAKKAWAGKYQSPEAMEKGYRELRDLQRRTAERAKAYEQRVAEVEFQARQMEESVRRATEYVRSLQQQQQQQLQPQRAYDELGNPIQLPPMQQGLSPEQVQEYVNAQIQEAQAYQAQAQQEQAWKQEKFLQAQSAQARFFEAHPEVERNGDVDEDIASTILAFNEAWQSIDNSSFNLGSEESLAIAYEASNRPALRSVLMKQPQLMDDDDGMTLARALANQIDGGGTTNQAPAVTGRMTAQTNTPFAERGSSPAPQQASPLDEFDQAVAEYRGTNRARGSKVFFGE